MMFLFLCSFHYNRIGVVCEKFVLLFFVCAGNIPYNTYKKWTDFTTRPNEIKQKNKSQFMGKYPNANHYQEMWMCPSSHCHRGRYRYVRYGHCRATVLMW